MLVLKGIIKLNLTDVVNLNGSNVAGIDSIGNKSTDFNDQLYEGIRKDEISLEEQFKDRTAAVINNSNLSGNFSIPAAVMVTDGKVIPIFGDLSTGTVSEKKTIAKDLEEVLSRIPDVKLRQEYHKQWSNLDEKTQISMSSKFKANKSKKQLE